MLPLPIDPLIPSLCETLRNNAAVVLTAETGAGKTTRIPPTLARAFPGQVIVLEPRRVAARAAVRRIAHEQGWTVGNEVGWHVRFDRVASPATRVLVVTEGILTRMLQADPFLDGVGTVVFDEFHERSIHTDLALALCRRIQQEVRPDLRLVVMSATIDAEPVAAFLGGVPVLHSPGRTFPVDIRYLPRPDPRRRYEVAAREAVALFRATTGQVLVFLPGVGEIRQTADHLARSAADIPVVWLYGDLGPDAQDDVLRPDGPRRIILATNVAETSVTVPDVTGVVDTGLVRQQRQDPATGLDRLDLRNISQSSAAQRAGRAGRTRPGQCVRLWAEADHRGLDAFDLPELHRVDLAPAVLQLLEFGERAPQQFAWLDPPQPHRVNQALAVLQDVGALDAQGLTADGRILAGLPVAPRLGRLALDCARRGAPQAGALAAAALSERDVLETGTGLRAADCDVVERVHALQAGRGVDRVRAAVVQQAAERLVRMLRRESPASRGASGAAVDEIVRRAVLAAWPDRVVVQRAPQDRRGVMVGGRGVVLSPRSVVHDAPLYVAVEIADGPDGPLREAEARMATRIEEAWLRPALQEADEVVWDSSTQRVQALRRTNYRGVVLRERTVALPDSPDVAEVLAAQVARDPVRFLGLQDEELAAWLARVRRVAAWRPELGLPDFSAVGLAAHLPTLCMGLRDLAGVQREAGTRLRGLLTWEQSQGLERYAPARIEVPSGSVLRIDYATEGAPVLAVRIQEVFGWVETPCVDDGRHPLVLHLLAPNHRPQQVTQDLRGFWSRTYVEVRRELRQRYPKHAWPDDPFTAKAERRPTRNRPK